MMRKIIFLFLMLTLYLSFPTPAMSEFYVIRLKNGGSLATTLYWSEGSQVYFFYAGGTVGVEKQTIERVEKHQGTRNFLGSSASDTKETKELSPSPPSKDKSPGPDERPAEAEQNAEKTLSPQKPPEKIDLKAYQDKMATLKADLKKTLTRVREADKNKDLKTKDEATAENRKITAEMRKLTDELKKKNNGELPADWWE